MTGPNRFAGLRSRALASFWTPFEPPQEPTRRQLARTRWAAAATLLVGALLLWLTLRIRPGDTLFYPAAIAVAVVWAIGGLAGGRLRLGWSAGRDGPPRRPVLPAIAAGSALVALFVAGAVLIARVPILRAPVDDLLDHARFGSVPVVLLITVVSGVAEEVFFRGTLYDAIPSRWAIPVTVVVYAMVTAVSGVPLLVLAAVLLGIVTALQRRATGGVLASAITHVLWSSSMLLLLPPMLGWFG